VQFNYTGNTTSGTWTWDFPGVTLSGPNPIWYSCPGPGNYSVTLSIIDNNGCTCEITKEVVISSYLQSSFIVPDTLCSNDVINFADQSVEISNIDYWKWTFGDGDSLIYHTFTPFVPHRYTTAGNFEVCLTVKMINGNDTLTHESCQEITILPSPIADFNWEKICIGDTTIFTDETKPNGTITSWDWNFGILDAESTIQDPAFHYETTGTYYVNLIVKDNAGCIDTIEQPVRIYNLPDVNYDYINPCVNQSAIFVDTSSAINSYIWNIEDGENIYTSNDSLFSVVFSTTGTHTVTLKVTDEHGCIDSLSSEIQVYPIPTSRFSITDNYEGMQGQVFFVNESENGDSYLWNFDYPEGQESNEFNPIYNYPFDGVYEIRLITTTEYDEYSCSDTSKQTYELIFAGLFVPNAFSPADPNTEINLFKPAGYGLIEYQIHIFDKWGTLLWSSDKLNIDGEPTEGWDGTYKGNELPTDVYIWKVSGRFLNGTIWKGSDIGDMKKPNTEGSLLLIR
jgi:gliding motility-associated-like protein